MQESLPDIKRGGMPTADNFNKLQRMAARGASMMPGDGIESAEIGGNRFWSVGNRVGAACKVVRLLIPLVPGDPEVTSNALVDDGDDPLTENAIVQTHDPDTGAWTDVAGDTLLVANPTSVSYDQDAILTVIQEQDGSNWVPAAIFDQQTALVYIASTDLNGDGMQSGQIVVYDEETNTVSYGEQVWVLLL